MFKTKPSQSGLLSFFIAVMPVCVFGLLSFPVHAQLDDPTRPPGYRLILPGGKKAATKLRYTLSSVRISSVRRVAIINNRSVEAGDRVNGAKVIAIYPSEVKLTKQGKEFTVKLLSQVVKKTSVR